ncbi:hypothetical protein H2200_012289 [Cladophialophora chaetospira]|uniref:Alpha/beta hydrolase fold-3 domain-containing protein n=1 Tax=Cladophialophora chaetospira TaxID=386627 RepID=A0AA38WXL1_9EURO|nr:hypothetical protein H2200_012289 [Cladophialophora chaetospira]
MPYKQSWLDLEKKLGGRTTISGSPSEIKARSLALRTILERSQTTTSNVTETSEGELAGVPFRIYRTASKAATTLPVGIWAHGGGWMTGDLENDDHFCRAVAEGIPSIVISVDYRLTPEYPMPTQLNDCLKVYKWAHNNVESYGGDRSLFYTIGGSAGAGLALQMANKIVCHPELRSSLKGVAASNPITTHFDNVPEQYKEMYNSYKENAHGTPIIDKKSMEIFYKYAKVDPHDSDVFTILAEGNHKNFPPVYFVSCQYDPLRDDATIMELALQRAGIPTRHDYYKGMPHFFWAFPGLPETGDYTRNLLDGIRWLLSGPSPNCSQ